MNIIVPIGGLGERFSNEGYIAPKPLIYSRGKHMIYWVLDSLNVKEEDLVVITYTFHLDFYRFKDIVSKKIKNVIFVSIPFQTTSVVQTLQYTIDNIPKSRWNCKTVTVDCDTFYTSDILSVVRSSPDNSILYKTDKNTKAIYSYIKMDNYNKIVDIKEKDKISDNANIGTYVFDCVNTIKKYCDIIELKNNTREMYISHIYTEMINSGINVYGIHFDDVCCIGTPMQLKIFGSDIQIDEKRIRFCFDLDNTLVTFPKTENDYTTVEPIPENINFLRFVSALGHTVIIHTARRMRTHGGNVGRVVSDIGKITFDTLEKFNIPFDEIYFGKPDADFYIDDKAVNCHQNLERETGFYNLSFKERSFNSLTKSTDTITKSSLNPKIMGEIHWYTNIPSSVKHLFPKFIDWNSTQVGKSLKIEYSLEKIKGIPISHIYSNKCLSVDSLSSILDAIDKIHSSSTNNTNTIDPYILYLPKLKERYISFDYSTFPKSKIIYNTLVDFYMVYSDRSIARYGVVHGDPVFSNILIDELSRLKFVDMRGVQGEELSIFGDIFYDYAKIYQSLLGYEFVLYEKLLHHIYMKNLIDSFKNHFISKFSEREWVYLQYLTLGLYFTLIPLHDAHFQPLLYAHAEKFYDSIKHLSLL